MDRENPRDLLCVAEEGERHVLGLHYFNRRNFVRLPLGNTPLKGARTLRKPDAVFVPPQVARQFLELRDKFYATQAKEDADEMGYWKSLADCGSDKSSSRLCDTIAGAGAPKTADDESETAGTVDQAILVAERRNTAKSRRPGDDALLTAHTKRDIKQGATSTTMCNQPDTWLRCALLSVTGRIHSAASSEERGS